MDICTACISMKQQMDERKKLIKVLSRAQKLVNANKNREALALTSKQKGRLAVSPDLLKIKARALTGLQRYKPSLSILQMLHLKFPNDVAVLVNIALNYNTIKEHDSALIYAEKALKLQPQNMGLLLNLASTYRANRMTDSAIVTLQRAETLAPNQPDVVLLLSELLIERGEYLQSLGLMGGIADSPLRSMLLLDCYSKLNWYDKAQELVAEIETIYASQDDYYKALFITRLQQLGNFSKAQELLNGPAPVQNPQLLLAYIQSITLEADSLLQLANRIENGDFSGEHEISLLFALSEKLFQCQENDKAHELLAAANQMQGISGEEKQQIAHVFENIENTFVEWRDREIQASHSNVPTFVVGMPRSGTTLVESILASHSQVFAAGETGFMGISLNGKCDSPLSHKSAVDYLEEIGEWNDDQIGKVADDYLQHLRQHSSKASHIVDKMPQNFLHLGVIRRIFPDSKIIHCSRNPISNCYSSYKQHFSDFHTYSTDLDYLADYYKRYLKLMEFWRASVDGLNLIEISYESVVTDFEPVVRKLLSDCGLTFEKSCLDFHLQERTVGTLSATQVRNQIYKSSLKPWIGQEQFIEPLLSAFPDDIH